ncbi:MAG: site-specific integrase [Calditrichaeota bacterium]|nr:site-specific integrase [Calditrichota bacterium]
MPPVERFRLTKRTVDTLEIPAARRRTVWDARIPKLCLRITPKGAKTWYYVSKHAGKTEWHKLGRYPELTPEAARTAAQVVAGEYAKGRNVAEDRRQEKAEWTVAKAWEMYRARNERLGGKSLSTMDGYWRRHFSRWESKRLSQVTGGMAERLQDRILETRSGATANRIVSTGKALFNFAIRRKGSGYDGPNPFNGLEKQPQKIRKNRLYTSQVSRLFLALDDVSEIMRDFILMALWTGRRAGEIKSMRWVDVDLESGLWLIPDTKANEPQMVPFAIPAIEILARRRRAVSGKWVFPGNSKSGHLEEYKKGWQQVRDEAGLGDLRFHDLRRSLSSFGQEQNVGAGIMGAQLGHKDPQTTIKHYTSIAINVQRDAVNLIAESLQKAARD